VQLNFDHHFYRRTGSIILLYRFVVVAVVAVVVVVVVVVVVKIKFSGDICVKILGLVKYLNQTVFMIQRGL